VKTAAVLWDRSTARIWRTPARLLAERRRTSLYWHWPLAPDTGSSLRFVPFELERWQSTWENRVRYNLSESGVHPLSIQELLALAGASRRRCSMSGSATASRTAPICCAGVSRCCTEGLAGADPGDHRHAEANFVVCWRLVSQATKSP